MRFGIIPSEGGERYGDAIAEAELAEELGFDSVWLEEHHGVRDHYWPSPLVVLAAIAARTSRVTLGTDVIVLPFYAPVRLAEDVAVLQGISGGRFVLGLAAGYRPDEFALHDASLTGRGGRLEEAVGLIRRCGPARPSITRVRPIVRRAGSSPSPRPPRRSGSAAGVRRRSSGPPASPTRGFPGRRPTWPGSSAFARTTTPRSSPPAATRRPSGDR
jgi:alkanesulfonate monooxygenase SsuD/methylene tetrahydromethanopterin reductase-like flavin-dependent oxidoreductase (luciferase family)